MSLPFSGAARPLQPSDIAAAASKLGCEPAAVTAVLTCETGGKGGFLPDGSGRPKILFEAGHFGAMTKHQWDATYPDISITGTNWSLYKGGAAEYDRLAEAVALDRTAALSSASWGLFQIMGSNATGPGGLGYQDVETFVAMMADSEANQLDAFVRFCQANGLAPALADLNWARFARGYNGPLYQQNRYDTRLATAYANAGGSGLPGNVLCVGSSGPAVVALQKALDAAMTSGAPVATDGSFGADTKLAVQQYQAAKGMTPDGVAGRETLAALGLAA